MTCAGRRVYPPHLHNLLNFQAGARELLCNGRGCPRPTGVLASYQSPCMGVVPGLGIKPGRTGRALARKWDTMWGRRQPFRWGFWSAVLSVKYDLHYVESFTFAPFLVISLFHLCTVVQGTPASRAQPTILGCCFPFFSLSVFPFFAFLI